MERNSPLREVRTIVSLGFGRWRDWLITAKLDEDIMEFTMNFPEYDIYMHKTTQPKRQRPVVKETGKRKDRGYVMNDESDTREREKKFTPKITIDVKEGNTSEQDKRGIQEEKRRFEEAVHNREEAQKRMEELKKKMRESE